MNPTQPRWGRVIASYGRHQDVVDAEGQVFDCSRRGRKQDVVCGDTVEFSPMEGGTGVIEALHPRHTLLYRSDAFKQKTLAANIDTAFIVVAPVPAPRMVLFNRCLIASMAAGITPVMVCNKSDLPEFEALFARFAYYRDLGIECLALSAREDISRLRERMTGHDSIVIGESGMGKSTLINALIPEAGLRMGSDLSLGELGKHTTTHARRLTLPQGGSITDTPGMQVFGLQHLSRRELEEAHPEFREAIGACRFNDCRHQNEPDCAFKALGERSDESRERLRWLVEIEEENARVAEWARPDASL